MTTNLSGSLSEFSLAEVLSLLGMGRRTARMQVTSADAVGTVHLVDGRISSATADSARAGLLRGVVAALPVPADDLAMALQSEDPVRALVESGVVDREAAQQVAAEHCTEAVGEMLDWTSGEFAVWVGSQDPSDIGVRLDVDDLVGAARERAQEWQDLRAALPDADSVLALAPTVDHAPVVDTEDWAVLARVDGRRTLAEVLAAMGASPLAGGTRLVQLMGRGLVSVQVGGGDAEQERTAQLLESFESGGGLVAELVEAIPVVEADEAVAVTVVEDVAAPQPEFAPDVHDLFVTEPAAVEEWQVAAAESWEVAEPPRVGVDSVGFAAEVPAFGAEAVELAGEPVAYEVAPGSPAFGVEPVTYELDTVAAYEPEPVSYEPVGHEVPAFDAEPVAYELDPVTYEPDPVSYEAPVSDFTVEPVDEGFAAAVFEVAPAAEPAGEAFAWSPWAQEMGLGEAPVSAAPEVVPVVGFADMVETERGHGHTDAFPVPQAPVSGVQAAEFAPVDFAPVEFAHRSSSPRSSRSRSSCRSHATRAMGAPMRPCTSRRWGPMPPATRTWPRRWMPLTPTRPRQAGNRLSPRPICWPGACSPT